MIAWLKGIDLYAVAHRHESEDNDVWILLQLIGFGAVVKPKIVKRTPKPDKQRVWWTWPW